MLTVKLNNGEELNVKVDNPQKALKVQGDITPNEPIDLKIPLDNIKEKFELLSKIQETTIPIINNSTIASLWRIITAINNRCICASVINKTIR